MYALAEDWIAPPAKAGGDFMDPRTWGTLPEIERIYLDRVGDLYCIISREDYAYLIRWCWCALYSGSGCYRRARYARRAVGTPEGNKSVFLHKEVLTRKGPRPTPEHCIGDHLSGKTLDNTRNNLRWATLGENNKNKHGFYVTQQYDFFHALTTKAQNHVRRTGAAIRP